MLKTSIWDYKKLSVVTYPFYFIYWQYTHKTNCMQRIKKVFLCWKCYPQLPLNSNKKNASQSKKGGKDQESIQSSTTPDTWYPWECDINTIKHHTQESKGLPFPSRWPQGSNEQTWKRHDKHKTWSTKEVSPWNIQSKYFTEGFKPVSRRQPRP